MSSSVADIEITLEGGKKQLLQRGLTLQPCLIAAGESWGQISQFISVFNDIHYNRSTAREAIDTL